MKQYYDALEAAQVLPVKQLAEYLKLVFEWNEKINITGSKSPEEFALKHIADTTIALKTITRPLSDVVDVGSGGGVPGIIISIVCPELMVTLIERRQKKANVLQSMLDTLGLTKRVRVIAKPFEEVAYKFNGEAEFWFRGFLPGPKMAAYFSESFPRGDIQNIVLMKGPNWPEEKLGIMGQSKVRKIWQERFACSFELDYELPKNSGNRKLVFV